MWRAFPWVLSAILLIAFGASFSELQRVRKRFGEVTRHTFHDHQEVRQFFIKAPIAEADRPIIVIGDSITEMAPLPKTIAGHTVVNAGIGSARTFEFISLAPRLLEDCKPAAIAIALGANDIGSSEEIQDFSKLISVLRRWSPRIIAISVTSDTAINGQIREAANESGIQFLEVSIDDKLKMLDRIHFTGAAYRQWIPKLQHAIENAIPQG